MISVKYKRSPADFSEDDFGDDLVLELVPEVQVGLLDLHQLLQLQLANHLHADQRVHDEVVVVLVLVLSRPVRQHPGEGTVDYRRSQQLEQVVLPVEEVEVGRQVQVVHTAEELHERSGEGPRQL